MKPRFTTRQPSWMVSLLPILFLVVFIFLVVKYFGSDSLSGGSQIALISASALVAGISMLVYGIPWDELEKAIAHNIGSVGPAILILILIGAIAGSWMVSGVVPMLICYGMKVIHPSIFLFACCLISAVVSVITGSSWTTIATVGVALLGIGSAQGYAPEWTAGAIISGAYFGDKMSPLSDTTVLASSTVGTPLFTHIRYMTITTIPSFTISLIIFLVASLMHHNADTVQMTDFTDSLRGTFRITPWLLTIPLLTGILIARKVPAVITLLLSAAVAGVFALIFQPDIVIGISGGESFNFSNAFKGLMTTWSGDTAIDTGNISANELVITHGMGGMLNTVYLILCATTFGGTMTGSGMLQSLTKALTSKIKSRTGLVTATVTTGVFCNTIAGDQYLSVILTGSLYKDLYKRNGYESRLLSRSVEDSATVTSVLIPWNSCGMTQSTVLRIPTLSYLPYCFFNILSPLMSILTAAIGYKIHKSNQYSSAPAASTSET